MTFLFKITRLTKFQGNKKLYINLSKRCIVSNEVKSRYNDIISSKYIDKYPYFTCEDNIQKISLQHKNLAKNQLLKDIVVKTAGRIISKRQSGKKLAFYTIEDCTGTIQVVCNLREVPEGKKESFKDIHNIIRRGDFIGINGYVGKTPTGELSVFDPLPQLLSPCLNNLPERIEDPILKYQKRYLEFLTNKKSRDILITRSKILSIIRNELINNRNYIEVNTPILCPNASGAFAKPFITHYNSDNNKEFTLRIAPEIYLKELLVGGFNKVFEIGQVFRNENVSFKHQPEFTSIEGYSICEDRSCVMKMMEYLLRKLVNEIIGSSELPLIDRNGEVFKTIDISKDFNVISIPTVIKELHPDIIDIIDKDNIKELKSIAEKNKINLNPPFTTIRIVDDIISTLIEPNCIEPTFIINHPIITSPLAKVHRNNSKLVERFELFINKMEIANAYTELNDPIEQNNRFVRQCLIKGEDVEIPPTDESFVEALTYGLPPAAGWGIGIDRLVMILTKQHNIKN